MSIRTKLIALFLALSLPFLVIGHLIFYVSERNALKKSILSQLESVASLQQQRIQGINRQNAERLNLVTSRTQLRISLSRFLATGDQEQHARIVAILRDARASIPDFKNIAIFSAAGEMVVTTGPVSHAKENMCQGFFAAASQGNQVDLFYRDEEGRLSLCLAGPLFLDKTFLGVLLIDVTVDAMLAAVGDYTGLGRSGEIVLAKKNPIGEIIFLLPTRFYPDAALHPVPLRADEELPIQRTLAKKEHLVVESIDYRGVPVLVASRYLPDFDWGLVVKIDKEEGFAPLTAMNTLLFAILVALTFFILLASYLFVRIVTRPVIRLTEVARQIAADKLSVRAEASGGDEISELATTFNRMADKLIDARRILEEKMNELRAILDNAPAVIFLKDTEGRYLLVNRRFEQLFGVRAVEFVGRTDDDLFPPATAEILRANDRQVLASRASRQFEEQIPLVDGPHTYLTVKFALCDQGGIPYGLCGISTDISEMIQARSALQQSKEEWEKTFDAMTDIITIHDQERRIVRANRAACVLFQAREEELRGRYCYELFSPTGAPCTDCPGLMTLKEGKTHSANMVHNKLGMIFHVTSSPLVGEQGGLVGMVHIAKDITEHKKMEAQLFQAQKMEAIGVLAGGIAHDFNNILSAIIGYAELTELEVEEGSRAASHVAQVIQAAQRASGLVRQILTFSRKGAPRRERLQPSLIVKEALKLLRASLPATLEIEEDIDRDSGLIVADPVQLHQIIVNLCTNALHAMEEETGVVTVRLARRELGADELVGHPGVAPGPFVELVVSDSGCGMDNQTLSRIFDPYFTTKPIGKGTGLGLAVVHGAVENCGGMITVESAPGKGSTFHVFFPSVVEEARESEGAGERALLPVGTERILVVDDESTIVTLYEAVLSRLGYLVTAVSDSEEALAAFLADPGRFDLLITDQTMPGISGARLAREVLSRRPDLPIILCTGYSSTISEETARAIGIVSYLQKPVDGNKLAREVRRVLDERAGQPA
ncbi:MAG: PAS domain-containing protein [Thermodesulfobacteriota bacterium]